MSPLVYLIVALGVVFDVMLIACGTWRMVLAMVGVGATLLTVAGYAMHRYPRRLVP